MIGRIHSPGFTSCSVTGQAMQRSGEHGRTVGGAGSFQTPVSRRVGLLIAFHIGFANQVGGTQYRRWQGNLAAKKARNLESFCAGASRREAVRKPLQYG